MKTCFFVVFLLLGYAIADAQVLNLTNDSLYKQELEIRAESVNAMKVKITTPSHYSEIKYYVKPFSCVSAIHKYRIIGSNIAYVFVKKDSTAAIVIVLMERDSAAYLRSKKTMNFWHPDNRYDPDSLWRYNAKGMADTVNYPFKFYKSDILKMYNADEGAEFYLDCSNIFMNNFQVARGIVLNKRYRGITEIYYFKRMGSKIDVNKEIDHTRNLLKFN